MYGLRDAVHHTHLPHVTQLLGELGRQAHDVVLTDRHDLHRVCVLVVVDVTPHIMGDQLLGCLVPGILKIELFIVCSVDVVEKSLENLGHNIIHPDRKAPIVKVKIINTRTERLME